MQLRTDDSLTCNDLECLDCEDHSASRWSNQCCAGFEGPFTGAADDEPTYRAGDGTRTHNHLFTRQVRYRLRHSSVRARTSARAALDHSTGFSTSVHTSDPTRPQGDSAVDGPATSGFGAQSPSRCVSGCIRAGIARHAVDESATVDPAAPLGAHPLKGDHHGWPRNRSGDRRLIGEDEHPHLHRGAADHRRPDPQLRPDRRRPPQGLVDLGQRSQRSPGDRHPRRSRAAHDEGPAPLWRNRAFVECGTTQPRTIFQAPLRVAPER